MDDELRARARAWTERTCAEQGVPVLVDDRRVLAQVAALLRPGTSVAIADDVEVEVEVRAA